MSALGCREVAHAAGAYVDGELEPSNVLSIDQHLVACAPCSDRVAFLRAVKRANRNEARSLAAPASLRARIARSAAQLAPAPVAEPVRTSPPSWRSALPWAAAAGLAIAVGGGMKGYRGSNGDTTNASVGASTRAQILEEFAVQHARPLPPEELDPVRITKVFSPIVGVPVRPVRFANMPPNAEFNFAGARLMALRDEPAATLFYQNVGGTRVTVFVFDPARISVRSSCCLHPKVVSVRGEERTILVGHAKGYSLAVAERDGVGYALSADLAENELVTLAAGL